MNMPMDAGARGGSPLRLGITGTDTGIGKTIVAAALAVRARRRGLRVSAMKPVESGVEAIVPSPSGVLSDVERLHAATGGTDAIEHMRPYSLVEPLAPLIAARRAGVTIDLAVLDSALATLSADRDLVLVEGAGGLLVPITLQTTFADLFARWGCELVLVAGNRLGVLNHVLLTVRVAESAGIRIRGIVLADFAQGDASIAQATNYDALRLLLPTHRLLRFPFVERLDDLDALTAAAEGSGLDALLPPASSPTDPDRP